MLVERTTYDVPTGHRDLFVELLWEMGQHGPGIVEGARVYLPFSGDLERVILELPWESWAAREEYMTALAAAVPASLSERWNAVLIKATREFFELVPDRAR
jgi:hypothetical protein